MTGGAKGRFRMQLSYPDAARMIGVFAAAAIDWLALAEAMERSIQRPDGSLSAVAGLRESAITSLAARIRRALGEHRTTVDIAFREVNELGDIVRQFIPGGDDLLCSAIESLQDEVSAAESALPFVVRVGDNFHYQDDSHDYEQGRYPTAEAALAACRSIVDRFLFDAVQPGMTPEALFDQYRSCGGNIGKLTARVASARERTCARPGRAIRDRSCRFRAGPGRHPGHAVQAT